MGGLWVTYIASAMPWSWCKVKIFFGKEIIGDVTGSKKMGNLISETWQMVTEGSNSENKGKKMWSRKCNMQFIN